VRLTQLIEVQLLVLNYLLDVCVVLVTLFGHCLSSFQDIDLLGGFRDLKVFHISHGLQHFDFQVASQQRQSLSVLLFQGRQQRVSERPDFLDELGGFR
jgi:hypothetical protein